MQPIAGTSVQIIAERNISVEEIDESLRDGGRIETELRLVRRTR
ncbi:MAG TPA: hypothetical protein VKK19_15910 [Candidatus Dormibacteraeota bacterium]|nr:hypothetical protein [Candidatus Dormibacteraeota bacterium]